MNNGSEDFNVRADLQRHCNAGNDFGQAFGFCDLCRAVWDWLFPHGVDARPYNDMGE